MENALDVGIQLDRRRQEVAAHWDLGHEVVLIGAGERIVVPGRGDRTYPFRTHSEYFYLTDRERPSGVLAFDPADGWLDFVTPVSREERLWEGATDGDHDGLDVSELERWLDDRRGRPLACLGAHVLGITSDRELEARLRNALNHVRRPKDELELARMRTAEQATSAGFAAVTPLIEPNRTEREIQIELEATFFRNGADFLAFDTIVGAGDHSAVLHFPPTGRRLVAGELVLIDAGAEYLGYASDVTRTYPVSGGFTPEQAELYAVVEAANSRGTESCRAGTEWRDVHRAASLVIAEGLAEFGLLRGTPESLVERRVQSLFFPHGVGHMVGLGVRDAGEVLPGRDRTANELPSLRVDLPLLPGYVVTVEPGIYFVPALVHDGELRDRFRDAVDWDLAERMLGFGGIRIEDNVLITEDGCEILTDDVPHELN